MASSRPGRLLAALAILVMPACGGESNEEEAPSAVQTRMESARAAQRKNDSLALARFTACNDSVRAALGKTAAGRKRLAMKLAEGATLPEIAQACGAGASRMVAMASPADSAKARQAAAAVERHRADSLRADSARRSREVQIARESFAYGGGGRDPFRSLLKEQGDGPELVDLQLVAIYEDLRSGSNSVALLRDKRDQKRYKVHAGDVLGRMRVASIRTKDVVFAIPDLGQDRLQTLTLRKQEDVTP